ncbi:HlyD family efflux transporter periplasmic adaptor subunit [Moorella naiadis]|uniref:HlyD family efflux transporter periplasmic adaptor subunit n=1 Tax=Moorella naiadis (nom. illeg.) TaxID=3093670 RepID=UPI003D9C9456
MKTAYNPLPPPARSRPRRRRLGPWLLRGAALAILILVAWSGIRAATRAVAWYFLLIQPVDKGTLEDNLPLEVYIAREEQVLTAPVTGTLTPVVPEGERVPVGATIARLLPVAAGAQPVDLKAPCPGQVSYETDGLEGSLQPAKLGNISYQDLKRLVNLARPVTARGQVQEGAAVVRLVNNLAPLRLYAPLKERPAGWQEGREVTLKVPGSDGDVEARLLRLQDEGNQQAAILEVTTWDNNWLLPRRLQVAAVLHRYRGIIIPASALATGPEGKQGVYLLGARDLQWQTVSVVGQVGDQVAVRGLDAGAEVVLRPQVARWLMN